METTENIPEESTGAPSTVSDDNSNRTILKRISAFGGVQMFSIIVNLIRGKFVALILGPAGMGVSSLFTTASATIQQLGSLGVNLSIVKELSAARGEGVGSHAHRSVLAVARHIILLTSLLGAFISIVLSPLFSRWTFGSADYTFAFILLGISIALSIAGGGYLSILQAAGEVKRLSKASIVGSLTGLFCGVPLYWFFGTSGIVPAMIILALTTFLFYYVSFRKSHPREEAEKIRFSWREHAPLVRRLVSLGILFMIGSLVGSATNYAINAFVRYSGSLSDVGLFQAANSVTNQYIGIVFSALAMDYFPRISAVGNDTAKLCEIVNRQAEIVILIATPLILLLIALAPLAIRILLSVEFLTIAPLIRWLAMGVLLQAVTFPLGYIFIAKDNKRAYVWLEIVCANTLWILCSVIFYYLLGLIGLGVSLVVRTALDIGISYLMCRHYYRFVYTQRTALTIIACLAVGSAGFVCSLTDGTIPLVALWIIAAATVIAALLRIRRLLREDVTARGQQA